MKKSNINYLLMYANIHDLLNDIVGKVESIYSKSPVISNYLLEIVKQYRHEISNLSEDSYSNLDKSNQLLERIYNELTYLSEKISLDIEDIFMFCKLEQLSTELKEELDNFKRRGER